MAKHSIVTKVWIEPGCIVCDACETDCPEVFDVQEQTCVVRVTPDGALGKLTPGVLAAAKSCPVEVIKVEMLEQEGAAPWEEAAGPQVAGTSAGNGDGAKDQIKTAAMGHEVSVAVAPAAEAKAESPVAAKAAPVVPAKTAAASAKPGTSADPRWQALLSSSKVSAATSMAGADRDSKVVQGKVDTAESGKGVDTAPDQRMAVLAAAGPYMPPVDLSKHKPKVAARNEDTKVSRRKFSLAVATGWSMVAASGAVSGLMFVDFMSPKAPKEPRKQWRLGRIDEYLVPELVYERFKRTPDGGPGFYIVNLAPRENRLVAMSVVCTHLGCVPDWMKADTKFKCPCHGSGFYMDGVNFEGPAPRPLERFAISVDADGYVVVDQSKIFRQELGEWDQPESYVAV